MTKSNLRIGRIQGLFLAALLLFIAAPSLSAQHHKHDHPAETKPTPAVTPKPSPTPTPTPVKPESVNQGEESMNGATQIKPQTAGGETKRSTAGTPSA